MPKIEAAIKDAVARGARREIRRVATPLRRDVRRLRQTLHALRQDVAALRVVADQWRWVVQQTTATHQATQAEAKAARLSPRLNPGPSHAAWPESGKAGTPSRCQCRRGGAVGDWPIIPLGKEPRDGGGSPKAGTAPGEAYPRGDADTEASGRPPKKPSQRPDSSQASRAAKARHADSTETLDQTRRSMRAVPGLGGQRPGRVELGAAAPDGAVLARRRWRPSG